jgi:steroid 5-alpha reductase family enzyme
MSIPQILMVNGGLVAGAMILLWLISLRLKDASVVDIFWGLGFVLIAWVTFACTPGGPRAIVIATLTTVWGLRLGGYLAWRNLGKGEDSRYKAMRDYRGETFWWVSLITVFGLQGVVMWLVSWPVQIGQTIEQPMSVLNYVGTAVWGIGFLFEAIGDYQLARFKSAADTDRKVMDSGLWRYTRHPNYFGNALIWWGLFLVAVSASTVWLAVSPIIMTFLLLRVSGVALLERSLASRSAEYRDYVVRTSAFVPWPPKCDGGDSKVELTHRHA